MQADVQVAVDAIELAERAAGRIATLAQAAQRARGVFTLCASGGSTPRGVYERLARPPLATEIDWQSLELYFGDERCVPPDDAQSNYRMLQATLLSHVGIPPQRVHRIAGELQPAQAAASYATCLRERLGESSDGWPRGTFDVVLLGLGADAHTASLFPGSTPATQEWVSARQQPQTGQWRVTLTEPVLNAAEHVMFLVAGTDKAHALAEVLNGPRDALRLPGQRIRARGALSFWVDRAAASLP